jgi:hypothetical protein
MAKTFIGELILRFKDESAAGAKKSAADITGSIAKIEAAAKRLNDTPWGGKFTQQLDKLGASSKDIDHLRSSWDRLYSDMQTKNLSKALQKSEVGNWKNATLQHFVQQQKNFRDELDKSEKRARSWRDSMQNIAKAGLGFAGAYGGAYGAAILGKGGIEASADWEREKFRLNQSGYSAADIKAAIQNSQDITMKYPQISGTQALELTKSSIAATGGATEGIGIAQLLARAQAVFQSQGKDADISGEMAKFTKGGELSGLIKPGEGGQERFKTALENWIKFSQIEGQYMSMSDFFTMTRRAKGAFAGANDEFIALLPSLGVDMTAAGAGTALSSLNKSYTGTVGGGNGKHNVAEQKRIGIRDESGIVAVDEFRANPFEWTQKYLIPALTKAGIDVNNPGSVQGELAKLIGNANAAAVQGTMVNQRASIQKSIDQRNGAVGLDAADQARYQDPFSGWMGFVNSLKNLAAAVGEGPMEGAVKGLNVITDGINRLQTAWRDGGTMAKVGIGAGAGLGVLGTWKAISGVYALGTAGPALNAAAVSLEAAAASLEIAAGGKGAADVVKGKGGGLPIPGGKIGLLAALAAILSGDTPKKTPKEIAADNKRYSMDRYIDERNRRWRNEQADKHIDNAASAGAAIGAKYGPALKDLLSVNAKPTVDTSDIDAAIAKGHELNRVLGVSSSLARQSATDISLPPASGSVSRDMNRSFADHGISP